MLRARMEAPRVIRDDPSRIILGSWERKRTAQGMRGFRAKKIPDKIRAVKRNQ